MVLPTSGRTSVLGPWQHLEIAITVRGSPLARAAGMKRNPPKTPKTVQPKLVTLRPLELENLKHVTGGIIQNIK